MKVNLKNIEKTDSYLDSCKEYFDNLLSSNQNPQLQMMLQLLPNAKQELFKGQVNEKIICYWAEKDGVTASKEYQEKFWDWCINQGYHNEDWVLDNLETLEESFEETLE